MTIEKQLVERYYALIKKNEHNPYYPSKREWQRDVFSKVADLKKVIKQQ